MNHWQNFYHDATDRQLSMFLKAVKREMAMYGTDREAAVIMETSLWEMTGLLRLQHYSD